MKASNDIVTVSGICRVCGAAVRFRILGRGLTQRGESFDKARAVCRHCDTFYFASDLFEREYLIRHLDQFSSN